MNEPELLPLRDAQAKIQELFDRPGLKGIKGFVFTARTEHSTVRLEWGDIKVRKRNRKSSAK